MAVSPAAEIVSRSYSSMVRLRSWVEAVPKLSTVRPRTVRDFQEVSLARAVRVCLANAMSQAKIAAATDGGGSEDEVVVAEMVVAVL